MVGLDSFLESVTGVSLVLRDHQFPSIQVCHEVLGSESEVQDLSEFVLGPHSESWTIASNQSPPNCQSISSAFLPVQVSSGSTSQLLGQVTKQVIVELLEVLGISCRVWSLNIKVIQPVRINSSSGWSFSTAVKARPSLKSTLLT